MRMPSQQRPVINRILLAVDFSSVSHQSATYARMFVAHFGAHVWVVHVPQPVFAPDAALVHSDGSSELAEQHMNRFLAAEFSGVASTHAVIRPGDLWQTLSDIASENDIDLIIAGTHGRSWLGKLMLGSAAELILRNATCPVLTVNPQTQPGEFLRILVPLDLKRNFGGIVHYARELANQHNAQIVFTNILHYSGLPLDYPDEEVIDDDRYAEALERIRECIAPAEQFRREPEIIIDSGVPSDTILAVAKRTGADLIIMPVRHSAETGKVHAPWHTAYRVIAHARSPVLTIAE